MQNRKVEVSGNRGIRKIGQHTGVGKSTVYDADRMGSLQQRIEGKLKTLRCVGVLCTLFLHLPGRENCYQNIWGKYKTWTPGPWTPYVDQLH